MIISASRRSDIPAFYSSWFLNRLREGRVLVRNPFNRRQVSDLRLDPSVVECIVFWTKNPAPLLPCLQEVESMGYPLVFQYTISGCDQQMEPGLPEVRQRIRSFEQLAKRLGPDRVCWRFDPIVFSETLTVEHYIHRFAMLSQALQGLTRQCTISFVTLYAKCRRNLAGIKLTDPEEQSKKELARQLSSIAGENGMRLKACCDEFLVSTCGIGQSHCIDAVQLGTILGASLNGKKDPGQRPGCGCSMSIDIGAYDSCPHGCRYCYANTTPQVALKNHATHDPGSPLLIGQLHGDETIRRRELTPLRKMQAALFPASPGKTVSCSS